jgi:TIR domain
VIDLTLRPSHPRYTASQRNPRHAEVAVLRDAGVRLDRGKLADLSDVVQSTTGRETAVAQIFISYATDDNAPPPDKADGRGFVTYLEDAIRYEFRDLGPDRPTTWRDTKRIDAGAQFMPEIEDALKASSILVVVFSPNWLASHYCRDELASFAKCHGPDGLRDRIVLVGKRFVDRDKRPPLLQGQVGFDFFERNADPNDIAGDTDFFERGEAQDKRYWDRVRALAGYLVKRQLAPPPPPQYAPTGRTIFVAKPASDMRQGYDRIVSELVGKGHTVVPDPAGEIPLDTAAEVIDEALAKAEISVHLLGEKAGEAPEDQPPMVKLQLQRAAKKAAEDGTAKFHRLVWAPGVWTLPATAKQEATELERHPLEVLAKFDAQLASDKIEGDSLSRFVDFLNQHLLLIVPPKTVTLSASDAADMRLFLYHSAEDSAYALNLAQALQQRKLETLLPAFDGPEAEIKSFNSKQLADCDGVILCWAAASEVWVRAQASGLRNWSALGRSQQFRYRAVVAAPPPGVRKKAIKVLFSPKDIDLFVDLSDRDVPPPELLDMLVPAAAPSAS